MQYLFAFMKQCYCHRAAINSISLVFKGAQN